MSKTAHYNRTLLGWLLGTLGALLALNLVADPFERNGLVDLGLPKQTVSSLMNYQIYKILQFEHDPRPVIVLGDSRSDALRAEYFAELGRPNVFNFAYGGGTLYEAIDTFWLAAETTRLRQVVLGVPFCIYTEANSVNRFPTARQVSRGFLSYYLSPLVTKASFLNILTAVTGHVFVSEEPPMNREDFWARQLGPGTEMYYRPWRRPAVLQTRLEEMVAYCAAEGIDLVFWIPPTHADLQAKLEDYGLTAEYARYKAELARLGRVLDYDRPGPLTADRDNFDDPYHFTAPVARQLTADLVQALAGPQAR